jgi:hypothetical protein
LESGILTSDQNFRSRLDTLNRCPLKNKWTPVDTLSGSVKRGTSYAYGVTANAELQPEIVVTLPFEFVVGGKTLPAGTYTVKRFSQQPFDTLMLTSYDNGISVFARPIEMEGASTDNPKVSFRKVGDQRFLSAIQTEDYVYNFSVSRSVVLSSWTPA